MNQELADHKFYRDITFSDRFAKWEAVSARLKQLAQKPLFTIEKVGQSVEGRDISRITVGRGDERVLLWSQMHGDEPTGTMVIFDLLNFFDAEDGLNPIREELLESCTFYFIPMLNPDGAASWRRRNLLEIDINRDFLTLQTPEARVLAEQQKAIMPNFGFNLHDQNTLWSVSGTKLPASISLMAPPVDDKGTITPSREKAIKLVVSLWRNLEKSIPGRVARWKDEYEPRAAGETFQRKGISTVLIEAGGYRNDEEKQYVRSLYFESLLFSFVQIARQDYKNEDKEVYHCIPLNNKEIFHLLIKDCVLLVAGSVIHADIGLNYSEEYELSTEHCQKTYTVADLGDLSTWSAYEVIEAEGRHVEGRVKVEEVADFSIRNATGELLIFQKGRRVSV